MCMCVGVPTVACLAKLSILVDFAKSASYKSYGTFFVACVCVRTCACACAYMWWVVS